MTLVFLVLAGCVGTESTFDRADLYDRDGDGVPDNEDCAPDNKDVHGDADGDGRYDDRCVYAIASCELLDAEGGRIMDAAECYGDGDDSDPEVYTGFGEVADVASCVDADADGILEPPWWAHDGKDNDCNDAADIADFDGDGHVDGAEGDDCLEDGVGEPCDCRPCDATINPGRDEAQESLEDEEIYGPLYGFFDVGTLSYNDLDEDCDGTPLVDWDGDGEAAERVAGGTDCEDGNDAINAAAQERCDDVDWNCTGSDDFLDGFATADGELYLYVDAAEPAGGNGSFDRPFDTVEAALGQFADCQLATSDVVVIQVLPGSYSTTASADFSDLAEISRVTLRAVGDGVELSGNGGEALSVVLGDEQTLVLEGLDFVGEWAAVEVEGGSVSLVGGSFTGGGGSRPCLSLDGPAEFGVEGTIFASCPGAIRIEAERMDEIVVDGATFSENTSADEGGAIRFGPEESVIGEMSVTGSTFSWNRGVSGGAIYVTTARIEAVSFRDSTFSNNTATVGSGGAIAIEGDVGYDGATVPPLLLDGVSFTDNTAAVDGGGLHVSGTVRYASVVDSSWETNDATTGAGGGFYLRGMSISDAAYEDCQAVLVEGCLFLEGTTWNANRADTDGGGLHVDETAVLLVEGATSFVGNVADDGGGIWLGDGGAESLISAAEFDGDGAVCTGYGCGIAIFGGDLELEDCTFRDLSALMGGALYVKGTGLSVLDSDFSYNLAEVSGGAAYVKNATSVTFRGTGWHHNIADGSAGGAVYVDLAASLAFEDETVSVDNHANYFGGFLYADTVASLCVNCSGTRTLDVEDGYAGSSGGALYLKDTTSSIYRLDAANNSAGSRNGSGGTVYASGGELNLFDCSVRDSDAGNGSAVRVTGADVRIENSWFGDNPETAVLLFGSSVSISRNIFARNGTASASDPEDPTDLEVNECTGSIDYNTFYGKVSTEEGSAVYVNDSSLDSFDYNVFADNNDEGYAIWYGTGDYRLNCDLFWGNDGPDGGGDSDTWGVSGGAAEHLSNQMDEDDVSSLNALFSNTTDTFELDSSAFDCDADCDCGSYLGAEAHGTWPLPF